MKASVDVFLLSTQLGGLVVLSVGIWMAVDPNFQESLASAGMEYAISGMRSSFVDSLAKIPLQALQECFTVLAVNL